jgi:hypothetical protein
MLAAAACATTTATNAPQAPAARPAPLGYASDLLARAGQPNAPTQQEIVRALGAADITRQDGVGAALTYRLDRCALLLLFAADQSNAMRLREAHASARHAGEAAPSLEQCATEADARRP